MPLQSLRSVARDPREPALHELDPLNFAGLTIVIRASFRRLADGSWRGRLHFADPATGAERETADILWGSSEQDLWQSVSGLRPHHLRDLYRSLE